MNELSNLTSKHNKQIMDKGLLVAIVLACLLSSCGSAPTADTHIEEQIQLSSILPKLEAIHKDSQALLKKNNELREVILAGLPKSSDSQPRDSSKDPQNANFKPNSARPAVPSQSKPGEDKNTNNNIDYVELEEFNRWVGVNLDYAVKNTQATIETLREEAQQNNGKIDYSNQAINDGIEGVKYWQSAVIFQDKTLKNEKFDDLQSI